MGLLLAILGAYIGLAVAIGLLVWRRAAKIEDLNRRLWVKSAYVSLVAAPTMTPTLPFSLPVPAIAMLLSGIAGPFTNGPQFWRYDLFLRAGVSGLLPIVVFTVLFFGVAKAAQRWQRT